LKPYSILNTGKLYNVYKLNGGGNLSRKVHYISSVPSKTVGELVSSQHTCID